jgi:tetratricopeptide repeat protein 30
MRIYDGRMVCPPVPFQGVREHPELSIGVASSGQEALSVGNSRALQDTAFIEAFNLKAAIEYQLKNVPAAKEALTDMPPRDLCELDVYTLHNRALMNMDDDPEEGFSTLSFLLSNPPFPAETFVNLLLLYIKQPNNMHDVAADTIAQYPDYAQKYLSKDLLTFIDASNLKQDAPEEAHAQFERLAKQHIERMRLVTKMIQVCLQCILRGVNGSKSGSICAF